MRLKVERDSILRNSNAGLNLGDMEEEEGRRKNSSGMHRGLKIQCAMQNHLSRREALLGSVYGPLMKTRMMKVQAALRIAMVKAAVTIMED